MRPIVDDFIKMYRRIAGSLIGKPIVGEELETIFQQLLFRLSEGGIPSYRKVNTRTLWNVLEQKL